MLKHHERPPSCPRTSLGPELLSVSFSEAAKLLSVSPNTVRRHAKSGILGTVRLGASATSEDKIVYGGRACKPNLGTHFCFQ
jgi:hypothetical protein